MPKMIINPVVMDSRFFEALKKLLQILLMILDFFDAEGNISDENKDLLLSSVREVLKLDNTLIERTRSAVGLTESAAACEPVSSTNILTPFDRPPKMG